MEDFEQVTKSGNITNLARVGKSDSWRSSSWDNFHCCRITRQANLCMDSILLVSFMLRGCQVVEAYSRIGRTRARYNVRRVLMGAEWKDLWMKPMVLRAFLQM